MVMLLVPAEPVPSLIMSFLPVVGAEGKLIVLGELVFTINVLSEPVTEYGEEATLVVVYWVAPAITDPLTLIASTDNLLRARTVTI